MHPDTLNFLTLIKENNTRHFFGIIKPLYEQVRDQFVEFVTEAINEIRTFDDSLKEDLKPKDCLFRIYRDARRLKEGDPVYKTNLGCSISPNGKNDTRAGYYLHIQPGGSFFGGGVYRPESSELLNLRHYLAKYGDQYLKLINNKEFKKAFGEVQGDTLTRPPRGFPKEHNYLDLIMRKQHLIYHKYTDREVLDKDFLTTFISHCKLATDFFHFLNTGYRYTAWQVE